MVLYTLRTYLIQILFSVGAVVLADVFIALANKGTFKMLSSKAYKFYIATGVIGTPVHELGHALFCVIFGHKIVKISLFNPDPDSSCLGYVQHTYNPKNLYQNIGGFFIAIGPLISGTLAIVGLMYLFASPMAHYMLDFQDISQFSLSLDNGRIFSEIISIFDNNVRAMFSVDNYGNWGWWVFVIVSMMISMHMTLSKADIKSSVNGGIFFCVLLLIVCCILAFFGKSILNTYTAYFLLVCVYALNMFTLSLILSVLMMIVAAIIYLVGGLIKKIR